MKNRPEELYLARDRDGTLCGYEGMPRRDSDHGCFIVPKGQHHYYVVEDDFGAYAHHRWKHEPFKDKVVGKIRRVG